MFCYPYYKDIEAVQKHVDSWKNLSPDQLKFERLAGLTNKIWKVSHNDPSISPKAVVFRKFGDANFIDREKENYVLRVLGEKGVGAEVLGIDEEYRIEKFCDSDHLTPTELNETHNRRKLARVLAKLHSIKINNLDKTPMFVRVLEGKDDLIKRSKEKAAREEIYTREEQEKIEKIMELTSDKEMTFLKGIMPKKTDSVVFSHNDLHSDNILCLKKNRRLLIIDYEYSDYNFRGYDIANLFNEALFEYHSTSKPFYTVEVKNFPSTDEINDFIRYYLFFSKFDIKISDVEMFLNNEDALNDYIENNYDLDLFNDEIKEIIEEVKACILFSHYYWILWSVVMSKRPDIKFDYISFAADRLEIYNKCKRKYFWRKGSRASF